VISRNQIRRWVFVAILGILAATSSHPQEKPQPQVAIDLKPLGAAPDLFADQSDSKTQQRGVINVFWLGNDRLAVAFSTNRRWSNTKEPEPLHVHLLIFDPAGKQLNERDWSFSGEGPAGETTLELAPGPDDSILAVHESNASGKIPEGDFIQVLNPDTSLRQDFYVPATSAWVPAVLPHANLVVQTFYANKHTSLAWWSGRPLKPNATLDLPPKTEDLLALAAAKPNSEETIAGPEVAASADCPTVPLCSGIRVFGPGKVAWMYHIPEPDTVPVPLAFLSSTALVVELRHPDRKEVALLVAHPDGKYDPLPAPPHGLQALTVTSVAADGQRLALDAGGEVGLCGAFDFWCKQRAEAIVLDIPANRIVLEQELSVNGGRSALSPDGKHLAIFDRDKLTIYEVK